MNAEELLDWAIENVHGRDWRMLMAIKTYEEEIKQLTKEQIEGIEFFMKLVKKRKFYQGFGAVLDVKDMDDSLTKIKELWSTSH